MDTAYVSLAAAAFFLYLSSVRLKNIDQWKALNTEHLPFASVALADNTARNGVYYFNDLTNDGRWFHFPWERVSVHEAQTALVVDVAGGIACVLAAFLCAYLSRRVRG